MSPVLHANGPFSRPALIKEDQGDFRPHPGVRSRRSQGPALEILRCAQNDKRGAQDDVGEKSKGRSPFGLNSPFLREAGREMGR